MIQSLYSILVETWLVAESKASNDIEFIKNWKFELRLHDITCDVVNLLDGIPQSTRYHPEFDAFVHTFYVVKAIWKMKKLHLLEAAFLHDVGKGTMTNVGNDRIYHFGHPQASVRFIEKHKNRIKEYELTHHITDKHMNFPIDHKKLKLKDNEDLRNFIIADKIISKELYIKNSTSKERKVNVKKEQKVYARQRKFKKEFYVMVGIPGSGKSKYLKNVDQKLIVSPDDIRRELFGDVSIQKTDQIPSSEVWKIVSVRSRILLNLYGKVYFDATNVMKFNRVKLMSAYNDCRKIAVVFDVDPSIAKQRIENDIKNNVDRSNVPNKIIDKMYKLFKQGKKSLVSEFNEIIIGTELPVKNTITAFQMISTCFKITLRENK